MNNNPPLVIALPNTRLPPAAAELPDDEPEVLVEELEADERMPDSLNDSPSLATSTLSSSSAVASNRPFAYTVSVLTGNCALAWHRVQTHLVHYHLALLEYPLIPRSIFLMLVIHQSTMVINLLIDD